MEHFREIRKVLRRGFCCFNEKAVLFEIRGASGLVA